MDVFKFRDHLIKEFSSYIRSFILIKDDIINGKIQNWIEDGVLWPDPLIQINPFFEKGGAIDELVDSGLLHKECRSIFRIMKNQSEGSKTLNLHKHQLDAVNSAKSGANYVLTTGTGSGKSLSYIIPIVDLILRSGSGKGIQAIIVYPMNALANSQFGELRKFLCDGYPEGNPPVTFERYTGQESREKREQILANPPDILLTNYVMLELILTRVNDKNLIKAAQGLKFLVLDELHTYRGRQGADVAMLVRRLRDACNSKKMQCVGTSATLSSEGSYDKQREEVARVATLLFGDTVKPENIIGETIKRITPLTDILSHEFIENLKLTLSGGNKSKSVGFSDFINNPLSIWIEDTFGIKTENKTGRLIRSKPKAISGDEGAAKELAMITGETEERCEKVIQEALLTGYSIKNPITGFPVFAFRLHQFISSGDLVYASLEPENERYITIFGQKYVPNEERQKVLLPLVFCRECGQEYYTVHFCENEKKDVFFESRELSDTDYEKGLPGFLYYSTENPWTENLDDALERIPEDWIEEYKGVLRIKREQQKRIPKPYTVKPDAYEGSSGMKCHFIPAPFRFCLNCGVTYGSRQRSDFGKLVSLGNEGRSTATTILSLQAIRYLKLQDLLERARKLLSFTDNRQDASLQSGHFNDFIQVCLIRSALYRAMKNAGEQGLSHDVLTQKVFDALNLPIEQYANDPQVRFAALSDTHKTLKQILGYRLYRDLKRGWRVTSPNLEQCGLLEVEYISLDEVCAADEIWQNTHQLISTASPETRKKVSKTLLNYLRRELAIKVDYLEQGFQDQIRASSNQRLIPPWGIDENENLEHASVVFPRSKSKKDYRGYSFLSPRGGFGQFLRRKSTFPNISDKISIEETQIIIEQILEALRVAGLVEIVVDSKGKDVNGYQIPAAAFKWIAGKGAMGLYDPIRVPNQSNLGTKTNNFFIDFYSNIALELKGYEAHEHTAQVPGEERIRREELFREGKLPILYCSPTMELGVDISELNAVNMRNMPPTPANYAQRSGRAGRSGQPALVFTYCSTGSPHDQFFFKRPELMVAGSVTPPRLDLSNEDLIRSHINAIWLTESNLSLSSSLKEILDLTNDDIELPLKDYVKDSVNNIKYRERALIKSLNILDSIKIQLKDSKWYSATWIEDELKSIAKKFDEACNRWRGLYLSAMSQSKKQNQIILDASRSSDDKQKAKQLRREAEAQLDLLLDSSNIMQSDFYSYRYFASEGFLPGYNFPRLPLSAYIPGRKMSKNRDEFLSRPRFLAISEFGPRSIIYHEGSKYEIHKVILPVGKDDIRTNMAKHCSNCGYLHPVSSISNPDTCEFCKSSLNSPLTQLFRLENVATKRRDRISSDEEERMKQGFEIKTSIRFPEYGGISTYRTSEVKNCDSTIVRLTYGQSATIWRINLGWKRRKEKNQFGFNLDTERGYWQKNEIDQIDEMDKDAMSQSISRVIPYVEDRRNCLLFEPLVKLDIIRMTSLQSALKSAIQVLYQLEENELAAEPLPDEENRNLLLIYESAEGGAGVLRHLLDDPDAIKKVAREALKICHFDPITGEDQKRAPRSREDCEAACYDCLMSYGNQREHDILDRKSIRDFLMQISVSVTESSPVSISRSEHLVQLNNLAGSELEKKWIKWIDDNKYKLPSRAQVLMENHKTRPDFIYDKEHAIIYVDGPPHDYPDRQERDKEQTESLEDAGFTVIRFGHKDDWDIIASKYPSVFK
jgi:ATP-dependent helicase YprA (DUF1998 family)/very-short-patch-repair endonuclease